MKAKQSIAQYTLEFKQEAIPLVKSGQSIKQVATTLGMPHQTLDNWLRADNSGKLSGEPSHLIRQALPRYFCNKQLQNRQGSPSRL